MAKKTINIIRGAPKDIYQPFKRRAQWLAEDSIQSQLEEVYNILTELRKRNLQVNTVYDCGVGPWPHIESDIWKTQSPETTFIGFEPNPVVYFDRLKDYQGILLPIGILQLPQIAPINMYAKSGKSSYLSAEEEWVDAHNVKVIGSHPSVCLPLDIVDELCGFPEDVFLWMDIEGSELLALKGAENLLASGRVKGVYLECTKEGTVRRAGEPTRYELRDFLAKFNFEFIVGDDSARRFYNMLFLAKAERGLHV